MCPVTRAAEPKALPDCPPETFAKNLTKWLQTQAGTKTIADVLAGFRKRYTLTEAQVEAIEDLVEMPSPVDLEFVAAMESAEGAMSAKTWPCPRSFEQHETSEGNWNQRFTEPGMTLRDYFAAHAPTDPQPWFLADYAAEA